MKKTKAGGKPASKKTKSTAVTLTTPKTPISERATLKKEATVEMANGRSIDLGGLKSFEGVYFVWLAEGSRFAIIPLSSFHNGSGDAAHQMREQGVIVIAGMAEVRAAVAALKRFPRKRIVVEPGWFKGGYALVDGRLLVPEGVRQPIKTYVPMIDVLSSRGTLDGWREWVATLSEHSIAAFMMMVMFAGSLLRLTGRVDNFGIELAGPPGCGKSTLQMLMATASGPAFGAAGATYWTTGNATNNAFETTFPMYNDGVMIIDEAALVPGSGKTDSRMSAIRDIAFRASAGTIRRRYGEPAAPTYRFLYVMSTNRSIGSLLGVTHAAEAAAIQDRLITLSLEGRPHGIFDYCPSDQPSTGHFAETLKSVAADHYGHASVTFLQWLVQRQHDDRKGLQTRIAKGVASFVKAAGVDPGDGSAKRVAEAFGLGNVAGVLAKEAGVLPAGFKCRAAARAAYNLYMASGRVPSSFDDRLRRIIRHHETIDLAAVDRDALTPAQLAACRAFLYTNRSGERELLVPRRHLLTLFPDWNKIRHQPEVQDRLRRHEGDRHVVDKPIGPRGKKYAVCCFTATDLIE